MTKAADIISKLELYTKEVKRQGHKSHDTTTTYRVVSLFEEIKRELKYRVPTPPIDNGDGTFTCPTCKTTWQIEDGYSIDDYTLCGNTECMQLFKGE